MNLVNLTVENSVKHVRMFVHTYLAARLEEARIQIYDYGQRYTEAMLSALDTSKQGMALLPRTIDHASSCSCLWHPHESANECLCCGEARTISSLGGKLACPLTA